MLAGTTGNIATLHCYDPDPYVGHWAYSFAPNPWAPCRNIDDSPPHGFTGPHAGGTAPTDIGSNGGSAVWVQNDYLPSAVRGGYLWIEDASVGCFQSGTAGKRTRVSIYYYGNGSGSQYDAHAVYYAHIDQSGAPMNTWLRRNNASASNPMWPYFLEQYTLNDLTAGGVQVGTVKANPTGCVTGPHLHQETENAHFESWDLSKYSEGCRATWLPAEWPCTTSGFDWVPGQGVSNRHSDIHFLQIYVY